MTNAEVLIAAISQHPGATDGELRVITGIEPHQQVNQVCRRLDGQGRISRRVRDDGRIGNFPLGAKAPSEPENRENSWNAALARVTQVSEPTAATALTTSISLPPPESALIILPCSKAKQRGGQPDRVGPSVAHQLTPELRAKLIEARSQVARRARVDATVLLPAAARYQGHLYDAAGRAITAAVEAALDLVILSGGFGMLHPLEPIGDYDRVFRRSDWPAGLLERALIELARHHDHRHVVAFCSRTTSYAQLVRRVPWSTNGLSAHLVTPDLGGRGGAQRLAPQATGEALGSYLGGALSGGWKSRDGIGLNVEKLA